MGSPGVELKQDLAFQRREWRFQRIGWAVMFAIMVAALAGLFAVGPLSRGVAATSDGGAKVAYARFARVGASTELRFALDGASVGSGSVEISLPRTFVDRTTIDAIQPEPDSVVAGGDAITYTVSVRPSGGVLLTFDLTPQEAGWISVPIEVQGAGTMTIGMFVYP